MKLRTGDTVTIISGKDKGKSGTIMRVLPDERRVVVTGINMRTKHIKKTFQQAGRIFKYEAAIDWSKVWRRTR
jgi:large subunit ribosomal protein L24